ncbi:MAG: restriction endonuclease subunit S, partial [Plesiomonas shigelloides]
RNALTKSMIEDFEVSKPLLSIQKAVADHLESLDNKITLNRQINQTLEQMAQALFKSWFVDFDPVIDNALDAGFFAQNSDLPEELLRRAEQRKIVRKQPDFKPLPAETRLLFPAAFEECEEPSLGLGGWVPKGWRRQTLDKIAVLKTESVQPNKLPEVMWEHYSIPAFDAGKKPSNDIGESIKSGKYKIPSNCVLVSKLNPETRRVWLPKVCSDKYAACSTEFMPFVPFDENYLAFLYCHLSSDNFQTDMCNRVSGTTGSHQRVKPKEVALMSLILPDVELINIFSLIVSPYLSRVQSVIAENDSLTRLRDTLLPKLISGELRLSDDGTLASGNTDC